METYLALEVTEQKVRYAVIERKGKGLSLKKTGTSPQAVGPSAPGALTSLIKGIVAEHRLKVSRIFLSVNRRDTMIHQLSLAKMAKPDLEAIIQAEIEKIPTFSDREFDYIYHEHEGDNKAKSQVIFAAIEDGLLQYLLQEVRKTGIPCRELELAPLNMAGLLTSDQLKVGIQTLIVLSDNITHLIVFEDRQIKYVYTTPIGKDKLLLNYAQQHITESPVIHWVEELKRVIKSYGLEQKSQAAPKIWLLWDQEQARGFDEYLRTELHFDVQPLRVMEQWFDEKINPIYFLAAVPVIYHLTKAHPQYSLQHFFRSSQTQNSFQRLTVVMLLLTISVGCAFGYVIYHYYSQQQASLAAIQESKDKMKALEKESVEILGVRQDYEYARQQLLMQATYVRLLKRINWAETLSAVASELPKELGLTSFKVNEAGLTTFSGEAFQMESISELLRKVETSSILERGKFNYLNQQEVQKKKLFRFGIYANNKQGEPT